MYKEKKWKKILKWQEENFMLREKMVNKDWRKEKKTLNNEWKILNDIKLVSKNEDGEKMKK